MHTRVSEKIKQRYSSCQLFRDDNFNWEVLETKTLSSEAEADAIESMLISRYPSAVNLIDPMTHRRRDQAQAQVQAAAVEEESDGEAAGNEERACGAGAGAGQ